MRSSQPTGGQHAFLPYLANMHGVSKDWYEFLIAHRSFNSHGGALYCAIEDRMYTHRSLIYFVNPDRE